MSKRFDQLSIKQRMTQRLQIHEDWANILGVGTIGNLLDVISEGNSEIARYLEYLYNEKKWRNARNMSSLTHSADLIAYKRALPKSSIGYIVISHTDLNGIERLPNFGVTFFDLDHASDFDDLIQNPQATFTERSALVPWTSDLNYLIPKDTIFKTNRGVSYISFEDVESRALKEPFSAIRNNPIKYSDFIKAGGWNGIKYLKVPVIQGEKVTVEFGTARGTRFESFSIDAINIENASNIISEQFFKVKVTPRQLINGQQTDMNTEVWEKIENIRLAGPYDRVFEALILNNENRVLIKFGDGITGRMLPPGANISVEYLETRGLNGNVAERFQITQMIFPSDFAQVDHRFNVQTNFLSCTNIVPIMGGKDIENEDDIRVNAPPSYLQSYSIATRASYYEQILKNSPINLLHCKVFQSDVYTTNSYGADPLFDSFVSNIENSVLQEISMNRSTLLITAIRSNGEKIVNPQSGLIEPLIKAFQDMKSPNDSFDYIEPNFIEIRPNVIVNTPDSLTEVEIRNSIMPEVLAKYSIFNTDFNKPYFKSDIINIAQNFSFNKFTQVFLEARTKASLNPTILIEVGEESGNNVIINDRRTLLAFPFKFDKIFAQNQLNAGFKNFKVKHPYVIRVDVLFREFPTKNKSIFLLDERTDLQNVKTLEEAEILVIDEEKQRVLSEKRSYSNFFDVNFFNSFSEFFFNQQVRTAQFNFIDRIVSPSYFYQMKQFNIEPYEHRPLFVDENGKNKIFNKDDIPPEEQLSFNFNRNILGQQCYRVNTQFIDNCKIMFNENYNNPLSIQYANGHLIIPLHFMTDESQREDLIEKTRFSQNLISIADNIEVLLEDLVTINVYAQPLEEKLECENEFDIIFSNRDNILIQKNYLKAT